VAQALATAAAGADLGRPNCGASETSSIRALGVANAGRQTCASCSPAGQRPAVIAARSGGARDSLRTTCCTRRSRPSGRRVDRGRRLFHLQHGATTSAEHQHGCAEGMEGVLNCPTWLGGAAATPRNKDGSWHDPASSGIMTALAERIRPKPGQTIRAWRTRSSRDRCPHDDHRGGRDDWTTPSAPPWEVHC